MDEEDDLSLSKKEKRNDPSKQSFTQRF